jgi:hypothetical protein
MDAWNNTSKDKAYKWKTGFPDTTKGRCIAASNSLLLNANCDDPMPFFCEKYGTHYYCNIKPTPKSHLDSDRTTMVGAIKITL